MQLFCRINALGEDAFAELKDLDVGDWIGVEGTMMRTKDVYKRQRLPCKPSYAWNCDGIYARAW